MHLIILKHVQFGDVAKAGHIETENAVSDISV
jgi:hypothetical protein